MRQARKCAADRTGSPRTHGCLLTIAPAACPTPGRALTMPWFGCAPPRTNAADLPVTAESLHDEDHSRNLIFLKPASA